MIFQRIFLTPALMFCLVILSVTAHGQRKKNLAVVDFDFATVDLGLANRAFGGRENLARKISDKLTNSLHGLGSCQVVERSKLEHILREQNLGTSGRLDPSTAARVGRILGVDSLIIGNVSVFDLHGGPKDSRDTYWRPQDLRTRIAVNYRMVNTTTALIELSGEVVGTSDQIKKPGFGERLGGNILKDLLDKNKPRYVQVKDEHIRMVVEVAVEDVVSKMTSNIDQYLTGGGRKSEPVIGIVNVISGRVIAMDGPSLVISGIDRAAVRIGDRLFVRRQHSAPDQQTQRNITYTQQIGEVEVVEIQDEVIIGSYSGSKQAQIGDIVTNNASAKPSNSTNQNPRFGPSNQSGNKTRSLQGRQERTFILEANQGWLDTGIYVQPGMTIEFNAEGAVYIDRANRVGPQGSSSRSSLNRLPMRDQPAGALIAKIRYTNGSDSNLVYIGKKNTATTEPNEYGNIWVGINDLDLRDNSGSFKVRIRW